MASLIKLDYDQEEWLEVFLERKRLLETILQLHVVSYQFFESRGGNHHAIMHLEETLKPLELLAIQSILGSDPVRECFNLRRIWNHQRNWNILFDHKPISV